MHVKEQYKRLFGVALVSQFRPFELKVRGLSGYYELADSSGTI